VCKNVIFLYSIFQIHDRKYFKYISITAVFEFCISNTLQAMYLFVFCNSNTNFMYLTQHCDRDILILGFNEG